MAEETNVESWLIGEISDMRKEGLFCDSFLFACDEPESERFHVHRNIMALSSPYFKILYTTNVGNASNCNDKGIPGISSKNLRTFIEYAYTRKVYLTWENAAQLLPVAGQFLLDGLSKECTKVLIAGLTTDNCIGVCGLAEAHYSQELFKESKEYTLRNITDIVKNSEEFLELPLESVVSLLSNDYANVRDEAVIWEACLRWLENANETEPPILPLLKCVRLGLLDADYFVNRIKTHPLVIFNESCQPILSSTVKFLYDLDRLSVSPSLEEVSTPNLATPRIPHEVMFAIGGWSGGSPTHTIETYDCRADRWISIPNVDPMGARAYHKLAVIGFDIYVIGGFNGVEYFNSCRCFNVVTKEWKSIGNMNCKRCYVSVAQIGENIFAMGGYDGHHRQNSVEKYDFTTKQWTLVAPMNIARSDACATTLDGKIFITGGFNGVDCLETSEIYDPSIDQWSLLPPMSTPRSGVSCASYKGSIYSIGGFNGISRLSTAERFDFNTHSWHQVSPMHSPRSNFAISIIDELLFVVGGFDGITTTPQVECYNREKDQWFEATDLGLYRSALASCVISGLPNVQDYVYQNRDTLVEEKRRLLRMQEQQARAAANDLASRSRPARRGRAVALRRGRR